MYNKYLINRRRGLGGARTARFPTFLTERKGGTGSDHSLTRSVAGSTSLISAASPLYQCCWVTKRLHPPAKTIGGSEYRSLDLPHAKRVLYHLSQSPESEKLECCRRAGSSHPGRLDSTPPLGLRPPTPCARLRFRLTETRNKFRLGYGHDLMPPCHP